jgi:hypothetical protein
MPATIITMKHGLDNIVSGVFQTPLGERAFITRKHIIKTTNKIYRNCPWKPAVGSKVLIDGDMDSVSVLVDHIEKDHLLEGFQLSDAYPVTEIIMISKKLPPATKTAKLFREGRNIRVRLVEPYLKFLPNGKREEQFVHLVINDMKLTIYVTSKIGGVPIVKIDQGQIASEIAKALGVKIEDEIIMNEHDCGFEELACKDAFFSDDQISVGKEIDDVPF